MDVPRAQHYISSLNDIVHPWISVAYGAYLTERHSGFMRSSPDIFDSDDERMGFREWFQTDWLRKEATLSTLREVAMEAEEPEGIWRTSHLPIISILIRYSADIIFVRWMYLIINSR